VPAGFADPDAIPRHYQQDADPALVSAIAGVRPIRLAAVLVPIIDGDEPSVLFTKRTAHLNDHAGQISFPGGKIDASDDSPTAAALREAEEEIALRFNKSEVDDAFEVPLAFLMAPENYKRESRNWNGLTINLYAIKFDDRNIWGATAGILRNLWERILPRLIFQPDG
jgi:8-oxo-dGTP pyrophosphatase MutT (NUDIX family)